MRYFWRKCTKLRNYDKMNKKEKEDMKFIIGVAEDGVESEEEELRFQKIKSKVYGTIA